MELIGYARVSTAEGAGQELHLQTDALTAAGADKIFEERASGALDARPGLEAALHYARSGDQILVWKLDRLSRSTRRTLALLHDLSERGIEFRSLTEDLSTAGPMGKVLVVLISCLSELERDLISERTKADLEAAPARGRVGGRPRAMSPAMGEVARTMIAAGRRPGEVGAELGVARSTLFRYLTDRTPDGAG